MADTLPFVVAFDLISGIIALLVSYYAFQARRWIESSVLSAISFGFMLLGAALLVEAVTTLSLGITAAQASRLRTFELLENLAYLILQVVALGVIAVGYARATYGSAVQAAAESGVVVYAVKAVAKPAKLAGLALVLFYLFLGLEFVILLVLIFIIFQGFLIYTKNRDNSSLLVLLGLCAHLRGAPGRPELDTRHLRDGVPGRGRRPVPRIPLSAHVRHKEWTRWFNLRRPAAR